MRGGLVEVNVVKFWLKKCYFLNLRGLITMSEHWLDYYVFLIIFEWVLYNWQPSRHSVKALGGFQKAV
jgi:hypothetical protein